MTRTFASTVLFAVAAAASHHAMAQSCPTTLAHLDGRLPRYNAPELQQARSSILREDMTAVYRKMLAAGMTPAQAAADSVRSAQAAEQQREVAKQCIRQVSTAPDSALAALENGSYSFAGSSIGENCAKGYVLMYYLAVAMKESAVTVACMSRN